MPSQSERSPGRKSGDLVASAIPGCCRVRVGVGIEQLRETGSIDAAPTPEPEGEPPAPLRLDVLGPLRLTVEGVEVAVNGVRRRAALALLAMASGRVVAVDALIDALWADDPPSSGRPALISLMSRVRGHLGRFGDSLVNTADGYQLEPGVWLTDVEEVRASVREARAVAPSDPAAAAVLFRAALDRWRGEPLSEFGQFAPLAAHAVGLHELRLAVEDEWLDAQMHAHAGPELVEHTTIAMAAEPLREQRQLIHIGALARCGRTRDALRAAHDYRLRLADEAGLEPTSMLSELERLVAQGEFERVGAHRMAEPTLEPDGAIDQTRPSADDRPASPSAPPRPITELYGRAEELEHLEALVRHERLVTLTGPGGIGKTRLLAELGRRLVTRSDVTSVYVALATLDHADGADAADVAGALAGAIGLRSRDRADALVACREWLGAARAIVIFDNCEHVLDSVRNVLDALLASADELSIVTTSRVPTGLPGECVVRLGRLPSCRGLSDADLAAAPAIELFTARARRVTGMLPAADELRIVADIVDRLDGVPLAIELAAARLSTLSLAELQQRIGDALDLLADGRSTTDARQRSLRATLEWSYRLLAPDERRVLAHLSAFTDGANLDAIAVIADELQLEREAVGELAGLVDASIVLVDRADETRYWMPEAVRTFALERHRRDGGDRSPKDTFLRWAASTAVDIDAMSRGADEPRADHRLRAELGNLRAAHRASITGDAIGPAVTITVALDRVASYRDLPEVWAWARDLVAQPAVDDHPELVRVIGAAAEAAWLNGDLDESGRLARRGLGLDGDAWRCHYSLATVALFRGDFEAAQRSFLVAAEHDRTAMANAALAATYAGDQPTALALIAEGRSWAQRIGSPSDIGVFEYATGEALGSSDRAAEHYERAIDLADRSGAAFVAGIASVGLASDLVRRGVFDDALALYRRLIGYWARTGNWTQQWITLANVAALFRALGDEPAAAVLETAVANLGGRQSSEQNADATTAMTPTRSAVVGIALERIDRHRAT